MHSSELTDGVRASVRSFSAAANLTTSGAEYLKETVNNEVVPRAQQLGKIAGRRVHSKRNHNNNKHAYAQSI
jgi:hypothetical protein